MTVKSILALFSVLLIAQNSLSQEIKWGGKIKEKRRIVVNNIVSHSGNETILFKSNMFSASVMVKPNCSLEKFNGQFNQVKKSKIEPTYNDKKLQVEYCFESGGKIFMLTTFANTKLDKRFLFVQEINRQSLKPQGKMRKIAELKYRKRYRAGDFGYEFSRDSSHILIYANSETKRNEPDQYALGVFDPEFNEVWSREVTLPYSESRFVLKDYTVDNNGNAFILGLRYPEKGEGERKRGKSTYDYRILSYRQDGSEATEYTAEIGDLFLTDMMIDVSPQKDIICAGFYSERGTWSAKGTYFLRIDRKTKEVSKVSLKEFEPDFITMNFTARQKRKAKKKAAKGKSIELYRYDLRDLIPRGDGGVVMLAEQFYITTYSTTDQYGNIRYHTNYHYNTVVAVSISPEGDIEWATKVPKHQVSTDDGGYFSSYVSMITNEKLYLLYNDTKKNLEKNVKLRNYDLRDKNGIIMLASIDAEGNVERRPLMSNDDISTILVPKLSAQVNRKELFLFGKRGKKSQMGIATF